MRGSALKLAFLAAAMAAVTIAPACLAQQNPLPPQQPGVPAQQQPPTSTPPASRPQPPASSAPDSDSSNQESSSKKALPPDTEPPAKDKDKAHASKAGVLPPEDDPAWDPFHAQQDIDVGTFYLHKGDTDAAITRFEDAIRLRANFAKPRLLLAETYEKKGDKPEAVRYYKEYLKVLPNAPDAKRIQQKIDKLSSK